MCVCVFGVCVVCVCVCVYMLCVVCVVCALLLSALSQEEQDDAQLKIEDILQMVSIGAVITQRLTGGIVLTTDFTHETRSFYP